MLSLIKNSIAFTNSVSEIASVDHHPAVFFTQSGTDSAYVRGTREITPRITTVKIRFFMITLKILIIKL